MSDPLNDGVSPIERKDWHDSWTYNYCPGNRYYEESQRHEQSLRDLASPPVNVSTDPPTSSSYDCGYNNWSDSRGPRQPVQSSTSQDKSLKILVFCAIAISIGWYASRNSLLKSKLGTSTTHNNNVKISYGYQGPALKHMGILLNYCYQKDPVFRLLNDQSIEKAFSDQKFGPKVNSVVNAFKESQGLPVDGVVDRKTVDAISSCAVSSDFQELQPGLRGPALRKLETMLNNCQKDSYKFLYARAKRHPHLKTGAYHPRSGALVLRLEKIRLGNVLTEEGLEEAKLFRDHLGVHAMQILKECSELGEKLPDSDTQLIDY